MSELTSLLCEIVRAEYSQWMRYTYLSALRFGPYSDSLIEHLIEHAEDELKHASTISRWIVDLGGIPPTDMEPVEPFNGPLKAAIQWLVEYEISGINKYQIANELACGIIGLQNDIGELLSTEHEHLSDLLRWAEPADDLNTDDPVIIVLAQSYRKFTANTSLFKRFANIIKHADNVKDYLKELLQMAWYRYGNDYTYEKGQQYILEDTQKLIERLWEKHSAGENVRDALQFYVDLYKTISKLDKHQWDNMHNWVWPDYSEWLSSDIKMEEEKAKEKAPFQQLMTEHVEPELKKPKVPRVETPKVEIPKQVQPPLEKSVQFPTRGEESKQFRRPIEGVSTIFVYDAGKSRTGKAPTIEVGVGDKIKNMTLSGEGIPEIGRPGRAKHTEGTIDEITPDGLLLVTTGIGKQEWNPDVDLIEIDARERAKILSRQPSGESHG